MGGDYRRFCPEICGDGRPRLSVAPVRQLYSSSRTESCFSNTAASAAEDRSVIA